MVGGGTGAAAGDAGDWISQHQRAGALRESNGAFRQGLSEAGFVEGRDVAIEYRFARNENRQLAEMAGDLVRRRLAVSSSAPTPSSYRTERS